MPLAPLALASSVLFAPRIGWDAPAACPDATTAQATLDRLLHDSPPPPEDPNAKIRITQKGDRFLATVTIGTTSDRELEGDECHQLADAALLIVAMAIDPRLGSTDPPPVDVPDPTPEPSADPNPVPDPSTSPLPSPSPLPETAAETEPTPAPPRSRQRPRALLRASAGVGIGGPPGLTAVIAIGVAARWQRARIELDGDLWTPRTRAAPINDRVGVSVLGWSVGVRGCGSPIARRFELPICGGLRTGALRGAGTGPLTSSPASSIWLTATAGLGLWGWISPRFALALDVEAMVALTKPEFRLDPAGDVFQALPAGLRAVFGPVVRLP